MADLLQQLSTDDEFISPRAMANVFDVRTDDIVDLAGLPADALSKHGLWRAEASQERLRVALLILDRVSARSRTLPEAYAWYRSEPVPSFGGVPFEQLVKQGHADRVLAYLDRIEHGGYA